MRRINKIVLHHSDSARDTTTVAQITRWHTDPEPRGRGYVAIGYHRVITGDGILHQGRPDSMIGAHAYGANSDSLGICLTGDFEHEKPSAAQRKTLVQTLAVLCKRHGLKAEAIIGHRDTIATACPGKHLYDDLKAIRAEVSKYL